MTSLFSEKRSFPDSNVTRDLAASCWSKFALITDMPLSVGDKLGPYEILPLIGKGCQVSRHPLQGVSGHGLHFCCDWRICCPALHDRGALGNKVDFAHQGGAEEDHEALVDGK